MIEACRASGFRSVNVDLIYGLPKQTLDGFATHARHGRRRCAPTASRSTATRTCRTCSSRSGRSTRADLPDAGDQARRCCSWRSTKLTAAGYVYIGMDHFALPDDDLAQAQARGGLHRNFMGYTDARRQRPDRPGRERDQPHRRQLQPEPARPAELAGRARRRPPAGVPRHAPGRGRPAARRPDPAADVPGRDPGRARWSAATASISTSTSPMRWTSLQPLAEDGLVRIEPDRIAVTSRGRLLLRNIAMCFDRYLDQPAAVSRAALLARDLSLRMEPCSEPARRSRAPTRARSPTTATRCISARPARSRRPA